MHFFAYRCSLGHKNALCCSSLQSGPLFGLQRLTAVRGCGSGLGFLTKCPKYSINTPNVAKHPVLSPLHDRDGQEEMISGTTAVFFSVRASFPAPQEAHDGLREEPGSMDVVHGADEKDRRKHEESGRRQQDKKGGRHQIQKPRQQAAQLEDHQGADVRSEQQKQQQHAREISRMPVQQGCAVIDTFLRNQQGQNMQVEPNEVKTTGQRMLDLKRVGKDLNWDNAAS